MLLLNGDAAWPPTKFVCNNEMMLNQRVLRKQRIVVRSKSVFAQAITSAQFNRSSGLASAQSRKHGRSLPIPLRKEDSMPLSKPFGQ
ncbi:MAG: hypothetical protein CFE43_21075 [Burkholderiales bacterium PBB3]|nr:MAG: hypothetical protein CFE43_21075 [Burkholderiales bacterium PBB3]